MSEDYRLHRLIQAHEGKRLLAYDDATGETIKPGYTMIGNPTIGIGRNLLGKGITGIEALLLMENDILECVLDLHRIFYDFGSLSTARQDALADMRFTLGPAGFRKFEKMIGAIIEKDWLDAANEVRESNWFKGPAKKRAELAAVMIGSGQYPA